MTVFYLDTSSSYLYSAIVQNDKVIASISKKMDKDDVTCDCRTF